MNNTRQQETSDELPLNILMVEDEKTDALLIKRALARGSVKNKINFVVDGEQALNYLHGTGDYTDRNQHPLPNLILLDLKLPKVSGLEVLRQIKAMNILKRIPVIILSASDHYRDIKTAYDYGANSYIVKKVKFSDFSVITEKITQYWLKCNQPPPL